MDNQNGEIKKLPIGFRFHPTDEELVVHYLTRKAFSFPLPASIIPQFDVFHTHPSNLPGDLKENRHFFTKRNVVGKKCIIKDGFGYWKASGIKKQIMASQINQVIGMKRSLVFYQVNNNSNHVSKTSWVMHEFSLVHFTQKCVMGIADWVVCRVFEKKTSLGRKKCYINNRIKNTNQEIKQCCIDVNVGENCEVGPPQLSSSEITAEISPHGKPDQEVSSGYKFSFISS